MPIHPLEAKSIPSNEVVALQFKAARLVVPSRGITSAHDIRFATADSTGAGAAQHLQGEELLKTIGP
jgi:hypothetical protein